MGLSTLRQAPVRQVEDRTIDRRPAALGARLQLPIAASGKYPPSVSRVLTGEFEAKPAIGARYQDC